MSTQIVSGKFTITTQGERLDIACNECGSGYQGPSHDFGQIMGANFIRLHKCTKKETT